MNYLGQTGTDNINRMITKTGFLDIVICCNILQMVPMKSDHSKYLIILTVIKLSSFHSSKNI